MPLSGHRYSVGDYVKYRASFLRSVGFLTGVPKDGRITLIHSSEYVYVEWCDCLSRPTMIHVDHVMPADEPDYS